MINPFLIFSIVNGLCFGAGVYIVIAVIGGTELAYRLIWLELIIALISIYLSNLLFKISFERQKNITLDQAERIIMRMFFRANSSLNLETIVNFSILNKETAEKALKKMVDDGTLLEREGQFYVRYWKYGK